MCRSGAGRAKTQLELALEKHVRTKRTASVLAKVSAAGRLRKNAGLLLNGVEGLVARDVEKTEMYSMLLLP